MKKILIAILTGLTIPCFAQNHLILSNNQVTQTGGYLVLQNSNFTNNSTFQANDGTVLLTGDASNSDAKIGGSSSPTFYNLEINKTSNGAELGNSIQVDNQLTLTSGNIDLQIHDLTITSGGTISGGNSASYLQITSTGKITQEVSGSDVVYPIGVSSYAPLTINNAGTTDNFSVRAEAAVYIDGTSGNEITTDVIDCTWYIEEATTGGSDVTLTFQWNDSNELTNFDRTQAFVSHYTGGTWNTHAAQTAGGSNPYTISQSGINSFSPFTVASDASVLPVELLYFYGEKVTDGVQLDWQTASEINNAYFDVEWSTDGIDFQRISQVEGTGTTAEIQLYDFLHTSPLNGNNYYRLKQVDFDGKFEYSNVIVIEYRTGNMEFQIYPNPASDFITIDNISEGVLVQIFNVNGMLFQAFQIPETKTRYSVSHFPKGVYFIKFENTVKRIVIQ